MAAKLAARYLFARKSHSAVGIIAVISVCGVALATMAIVFVLSVFNGFQGLVSARDARIIPNFAVTAANGAVINDADSLVAEIRKIPEVEIASPVVEDNAVAYRAGYQLPVRILGVEPDSYLRITGIKQMMKGPGSFINSATGQLTESGGSDEDEIEAAAGEFDESALFVDAGVAEKPDTLVQEPAEAEAVISVGTASRLGYTSALTPEEFQSEDVTIYMPRRTASVISETNPLASFMLETLSVRGVVETEQKEFDANTVIIDIDRARELLEYSRQASAIYIGTKTGSHLQASDLQKVVGSSYVVKDRMAQQPLYFRMIKIEKWITFLFLSFILLIASFNVISTISMLIVDKRKDIITLSRIGASKSMISEVFCWESAYVCAAGTLGGMILGVLLCLIQEHFGIIGIGGDPELLMVTAYPVKVILMDLLLVLIPSLGIASVTAFVASGFARRQLSLGA